MGGNVYRLFADAVVVIHFLFIIFVVGGGLLVIRRPRLAWVHLPAAFLGAIVEINNWICPLTPLENHLRRLGGGSLYNGDFIEHYLIPTIYPENLTVATQHVLGGLVIAVNLIFYTIVVIKYHSSKT